MSDVKAVTQTRTTETREWHVGGFMAERLRKMAKQMKAISNKADRGDRFDAAMLKVEAVKLQHEIIRTVRGITGDASFAIDTEKFGTAGDIVITEPENSSEKRLKKNGKEWVVSGDAAKAIMDCVIAKREFEMDEALASANALAAEARMWKAVRAFVGKESEDLELCVRPGEYAHDGQIKIVEAIEDEDDDIPHEIKKMLAAMASTGAKVSVAKINTNPDDED